MASGRYDDGTLNVTLTSVTVFLLAMGITPLLVEFESVRPEQVKIATAKRTGDAFCEFDDVLGVLLGHKDHCGPEHPSNAVVGGQLVPVIRDAGHDELGGWPPFVWLL